MFPGQNYVAYFRAFFTKPNTTANYNNIVCFCHQTVEKVQRLMLFSRRINLITSDSIYDKHLEDLIESFSMLSADLFPGQRPAPAGELRGEDHRKLIQMRV